MHTPQGYILNFYVYIILDLLYGDHFILVATKVFLTTVLA